METWTPESIWHVLGLVSLFGACAYIAWLFFQKRSRLLFVEVIFEIESADEVIDALRESRKEHSLNTPEAKGLALHRIARAIRWSRTKRSRIIQRVESYSELALAKDLESLLKRQEDFIGGDGSLPRNGNAIVGLMYVMDFPSDTQRAGLDSGEKQLVYLHDEGPFAVAALGTYFYPLDPEEDPEEIFAQLESIRVPVAQRKQGG